MPSEPRLSLEEFGLLDVALSSGVGPYAVRDRCMLHLMGRMGLRCGEALLCLSDDFNPLAATLACPTLKMRSPGHLEGSARAYANRRTLPILHRDTLSVIQAQAGIGETIICKPSGEALSSGRQHYRRTCERWGLDILGRHLHPHMLRHFAAQSMKDKGWDLADLSWQMRHANLQSTLRYFEVDAEQIRSRYAE